MILQNSLACQIALMNDCLLVPRCIGPYFAPEFTAIHRCGIAVTAHAGENNDAEGIWQAVFKLHARRLGHALHLAQAPDLERSVIERRIGVEMCPFANYQIKGFAPMPDQPRYPLLDYLRKGIPVTVNADNIGISAASLSENRVLSHSDFSAIEQQLDEISIEPAELENAALNFTGGNKLMATAAFRWASRKNLNWLSRQILHQRCRQP